MELRNFIKETLYQIAWGASDAQKELPPGAKVSPADLVVSSSTTTNLVDSRNGMPATVVEFDVAITAQEGTATKGGVGIFVVGLGLGSQGQSNASSASSSRVKFSVPIQLARDVS